MGFSIKNNLKLFNVIKDIEKKAADAGLTNVQFNRPVDVASRDQDVRPSWLVHVNSWIFLQLENVQIEFSKKAKKKNARIKKVLVKDINPDAACIQNLLETLRSAVGGSSEVL